MFTAAVVLLRSNWMVFMGDFIRSNSIWIAAVTAIVLTMLIKISSKPDYISLNKRDFFDFGFDLSISSIILVLTNIGNKTVQTSILSGIWILMISFVLIMAVSVLVNRKGWIKDKQEPNLLGVILPDILGIGLLIVATLYVGGIIK